MTKQETATQTTVLFPNIFQAIKGRKLELLNRFINDLNEESDTWVILGKWYYSDLLTPAKKKMIWAIDDLKAYLIDRKRKSIEQDIQKTLTRLLTVEKAGEFKGAVVSIEWKKSRMWGNNPTAEAHINTGSRHEFFNSGSISGCGYDKESTAVANAMNQSNEFLKLMCLEKEKAVKMDNRELFGYGSGSGVLPQLEGGVGVSCYNRIFNAIGFEFKNTASGKTFDVYSITPIK
jgi:hypothetical protein